MRFSPSDSTVAQTGARYAVAVAVQAFYAASGEIELGFIAALHWPASGLGAADPAGRVRGGGRDDRRSDRGGRSGNRSGGSGCCGNHRPWCGGRGGGLAKQRRVVLNKAIALALNRLDAAGALDLPGIRRVLSAPGRIKRLILAGISSGAYAAGCS